MLNPSTPAPSLPDANDIARPERLFKSFYFLFFAALAALFPFLTLYYEGLGMSGRQIGVLTAIPPLISLFAASLWGGLADATRRHRLLLGLATVGTIVSALAISRSSSFLGLGLIVTAFAFFMAPINPLVDNSAVEMLGERRSQYGRLRLWGSVGWGLCAPLAGLLVERFGLQVSFASYALVMAGGLLVILRLPIGESSIGSSFWRGFRILMGNSRWVFFLVVVFIAGLGAGIVNNYLFLYMNQLGASEGLMGFALTVATLSELVVFALSDRMLKRWGTGRLLAASIVAMVIRLLAYSAITTPWLVLVVQLLHGFTFAALWTAGVAYANSAAPRGMGATAQGIFSGVTMGLAVATGAFIGGWLYQSLGAVSMFRVVGIGIAVALLVAALAGKFLVEPEPAASYP